MDFVLAVHGGAGTITRTAITPEQEAGFRAGLERALRVGHRVLAAGGSAIDAAVAAVVTLEDDPLFNAGKGAVLNAEGRVELDAAVMDGRSGQAGAVAGVTTVKNPVLAARAVMDKTAHVLLAGPGADRFAADCQLELVDNHYFVTPHRSEQLRRAREAGRISLDHDGAASARAAADIDGKFGTVGAVALDALGNLAAATSTGGLTNKQYGRVGDSPIIGAGTFADNTSVAVSATGSGEFFMRGLVAHDVAARMRYAGASLADAVEQTIATALTAKGGHGGLIAIDARGNVSLAFNTEGMYRGVVHADGLVQIGIYRD